MDERLIAVPCAGVTLMPHDARVQSSLACLHEAVVVTEAAARGATPGRAPRARAPVQGHPPSDQQRLPNPCQETGAAR
jgi:hypothetical protein